MEQNQPRVHATSGRVGALLVVSALTVGCYTGLGASAAADHETSSSPGGESGDPDSAGGSDAGDSGADEAEINVGASSPPRLTVREYENTIVDLLGLDIAATVQIPADSAVGLFAANDGQPPTELHIEKYMEAAEVLAAATVADLETFLPCAADPNIADTCAQVFIADFGKRVHRRPLTQDQIDLYVARFELGRAQHGFANGIELVLQTMLQSPYFLYRIEAGGPVTS